MTEKRLGFIERSSRKKSLCLSSEVKAQIMSDKLQFVDWLYGTTWNALTCHRFPSGNESPRSKIG
jgi:hypothetical protein